MKFNGLMSTVDLQKHAKMVISNFRRFAVLFYFVIRANADNLTLKIKVKYISNLTKIRQRLKPRVDWEALTKNDA